jgi:hypothetical protein
MGKIFCILLILVTLLTGCGQSSQNSAAENKQIKIDLEGKQVTLTQPALVKNDTVYIALEDMAGLPGIKIDYDKTTGQITATRNASTMDMKIDQPLKAGDTKGPAPFMNKGVVYLPLRDTLHGLDYNSQEQKSNDGTITIILEKLGLDTDSLWKHFSAEELKVAEAALAAGVTITDPQHDWAPINEGTQPDGRSDNGHPYPLDFTDVKTATFGADSQYLYLKVEFYGVIPKDVVHWHNELLNKDDIIFSFSCNLGLGNFQNRNTGKPDGGLMQLGLGYIEGNIWNYLKDPVFYSTPVVAISNFATNTGTKDEHNEDIYAVSNGKGLVSGGAGTNYLIGAFPLSNFGLQLGDFIEFNLSVETGSLLFHHESIDIILDSGFKEGETIRYKLGDNTYENLGPPKNMPPLTK